MSSYILGLNDYIPQVQKFEPNLNYYGNILNTKQSKYDTAHKELSGIYGTMLNGPMLRDSNIARRDQFFKQIDQDIKKISGMDLSLQQNVDAAKQVFKPLIQDKHILKDMTWTKQLQDAAARGQNFKYCTDAEKCGGMYSETGMMALQYQAEEFKNASDDESLRFSAPDFVPDQDVDGIANKIAKDMGVKVKRTGKVGGYIVTTEGGVAMEAPLQNLFMSQLGANPQVQAMYKKKAYVQRKSMARSTAALFGGDESLAEAQYLTEANLAIEKDTKAELFKVKEQQAVLEAKKAGVKKLVEQSPNGVSTDSPLLAAYKEMQAAQAQNQGVIAYHEGTAALLDKKTTLGLDKSALRSKIDGAVANQMFTQAMGRAAKNYSELHSEQSMVADPFALKAQDFQNQIKLKNLDYQYDIAKMDRKYLQEQQQAVAEGKVAAPMTKNATYVKAENPGGATSSGAFDEHQQFNELKDNLKNTAKQKADAYLQGIFNFYKEKIDSDPTTAEAYGKAFKDTFGKAYTGQSDYTKLGNDNLATTKAASKADDVYKGLGFLLSESDKTKFDPDRKALMTSWDRVSNATKFELENSKNIADYKKSSLSPEELLGWKAFINEKGEVATYAKFKQEVLTRPELMLTAIKPALKGTNTYFTPDREQVIQDLYNKQVKLYKDTYNGGYSMTNGKPLVPSFMTAGSFSEGLAGGAMAMKYDAANKTEDFQKLSSSIINTQPAYVSTGGLTTVTDLVSKVSDEDRSAKQVDLVQKYLTQANSSTYKTSNADRPMGDIVITAVGANQPNLVGVTVKLSPGFIKDNIGTKDVPGPTADPSLYEGGITMYLDKSKLKNDPYWAPILNVNPITADMAMNGGRYTINQYSGGGHLDVNRLDDGSYQVHGSLMEVSGDGKLIPRPITVNTTADPATFIPIYEEKLKGHQQSNYKGVEYINSLQDNTIKTWAQFEAYIQSTQQ